MSNTTDVLMVDGQFIGYLPPTENFELLWENQDPTASFASQSVTLANDDYDFLLINFRRNASYNVCNSTVVMKGQSFKLSYANTSSTGAESRDRTADYVNDKSYTFQDAYEAVGTTANSKNNARCIPVTIYGIKLQGAALGNAGNVYSTTEHIVGKWIDGSDLYEKTINTGALPNNTTVNTNHNISNLKAVVEIKGVGYNSTNGNSVPLPYYVSSNGVQIYTNATQIKITTTSNFSGYNGYITLRYIKN